MMTRYYRRPDDSLSLSDNLIRTIFQDESGDLWIGTENGLNKFDYSKQQFHSYFHDISNINSISNNKVYALYEDREGLLWIGTYGGGIDIYNKKNNTYHHYQFSFENNHSLSNNKVYCIYEDRTENIWIGTYSGVNKVNRSSSNFKHFTYSQKETNCLNSKIVWGFYEDTLGVIWIATNNGINIYDENKGNFTAIQKEHHNTNTLSSNSIRCIIKDREGIYWIGTEDAGVDRLDIKKWEFMNFSYSPFDKNTLCDNNIWFIYEDQKSYLWIGTLNGLSRYDRHKQEFKNYRNDLSDSTSICGNIIYSAFDKNDDKLFFCTNNGICSYDYIKDNFQRYSFDNDGQEIKDIRIVSMTIDKEGTWWLGTMGEGLIRYNPLSKTSKFFTEKNGLPNNIVYAALEDNNENLWLSTNWGLSKLNIKTESILNYDIEDGIQSYEFNAGAAIKSKNGEMYFGGMNGFNSFFPDEIISQKGSFSLMITDLKIFNKQTDREYMDGDTISLQYYDNFFSFEFSALDFLNPQKIKYSYLLEDVDKDWIITDATNRFAEYKNTRAGTYKFNVKASFNDKEWSDNGISITVIITPPWWNTLLFKILFSSIIILIILFIITQRFRTLKRKHKKEKDDLDIKQKLMDLERKSLRLQMNPHFIFNSLNSIQSFVVSSDSDKAIHYLAKFSKLMRMILHNSRETHIPLSEEVKSLKYYMDMEKLRFDDKFDYRINISPKIDTEFIGIPPMIIQPYIENSIIHGLIHKKNEGNIKISIELVSNSIYCIIEDDGIGREMSKQIKDESGLERKSTGMKITKERLHLLSKAYNEQFLVDVIDLKNQEGKATGTRIELRINYIEL